VLQHENILRLRHQAPDRPTRAARSASDENTTALPSCSNSFASAAEPLEDRALGRQVAEQRDKTALRLEWLLALRDDGAVNKRIGWRGKPLM